MKPALYFNSLLLIVLVNCTPSKKKDIKADSDEFEIADPTSSSQEPKVYTIEIKDMKYDPAVLHLHKGDQVVWINKDIVEHDVTSQKNKSWTSSKMPTGSTWSKVMQRSETYYCSIHVVMKGKIIVDGIDIAMVNAPQEITMCK